MESHGLSNHISSPIVTHEPFTRARGQVRLAVEHERLVAKSARKRREATQLLVRDELPWPVPISLWELEVVEIYLGELLTKVLDTDALEDRNDCNESGDLP